MNRIGTSALLALLALSLLAGCPRESPGNGSDTAPTEPPSAVPSSGEAPDLGAADKAPAEEGLAPAEGEPTGDSSTADTAVEPPVQTTTVVLETSKGEIILAVHADWSPLGAAHFLELVESGYYDGAPWFRVFKDPSGISVAQCGMAADPAVTAQWMNQTIKDEPVVKGNERGTVAFGKSGLPNSRSTHIFINLADNGFALDRQGFSCFAEVVQGLEVADSLTETGSTAVDQATLAQRGIDYFKEVVPDGDVILRAYVRE